MEVLYFTKKIILDSNSLTAKKISINANVLKTLETIPSFTKTDLKREKRNVKSTVDDNHPNSNNSKNINCPPFIF